MWLASKRLQSEKATCAVKGCEAMERRFETVAISDIKSWLYQRRLIDYNEHIGAMLSEIIESVKDKGVIEPIICRRLKNGDLQGIAGYLRYLACQKLDIKEIPAIVYTDLGDLEATDILLVENLDRQEMADIDIANVLAFYVKAGIKQTEIAKRIHKSESYVSQYLALLKDSEPIRQALSEKTEAFTEKHARLVRQLPSKLHKKAVEAIKGKTVREAKQVVKQLAEENKAIMLREQIKELEARLKEIEQAQAKKLELEREIAEISGKVKALKPSSMDIKRIIAKIERIRSFYFPKKEQLAELKAKRKEILKTFNPKADIEPLKKERAEIYERIAKKNQKIKELREELKKLQEETRKLEKEAKRLTEQIELYTTTKNELKRIESEIKNLTQYLKGIESDLGKEIKNYDKLVKTVEASEKELLAKREEYFKQIAQLKEKVRQLNGKIANRTLVERKLESLKAELKNLES
jgi:ParB/RepB/Spo0J family partition protein